MKERLASREAEIRKELEILVAAARASSAPSTTAISVAGDAGVQGPSSAGGALTDRALLACRDETTGEHVSNPFAIAPSVTSTNANAVGFIDEVVAERPDSLNISSSFSRSVDEVECRSFLECGRRCCDDATKCDCAAYALDSGNRNYFEGLRARQVSEAQMLDADLWDARTKDLGGTGSPERKRPIEAQKQRVFEESARQTLNELQVPALPTFDAECREDEVDNAGCETLWPSHQRLHRPGFRTLWTPCQMTLPSGSQALLPQLTYPRRLVAPTTNQ
jgi:hypothetical protein